MLLVERFDCSAEGQHHLVSVASLINKFDITQYDESAMSYPGIFQLGNRIGSRTLGLAETIFRRMIYNVAIGNTDVAPYGMGSRGARGGTAGDF